MDYARIASRTGLPVGLRGCCVLVAAITTAAWLGMLTGIASAAERTLDLPAVPFRYVDPPQPEYFPSALVPLYDAQPHDNPVTDAGAALGRVLFHDVRLSQNESISCASCHQQEHGFSDSRRVSIGFDGQATDRNSMALGELRYVRAGFFWDERAATLEEAVLQPLYSHVEMGLDRDTMLTRLSGDPRYAPLFTAAFGTAEVSEQKVARALAQFIRAIETSGSKYDRAVAEVEASKLDFPAFSASENLGKHIFFDRCALCHRLGEGDRVGVFAMFRSLNNGIDTDGRARDGGRGDVTFNPGDVGLFRASSLRNVELTAPYMHDGRFATLEDVIEHYSTGVQRHPTLGPVARMQLSEAEKTGLVDFLKTLTDHGLGQDERFSNPWRGGPPMALARAPQPAPATKIPGSPSDRVANGTGLSTDETLPWLLSLDLSGDQVLDAAETTPIIDALARAGTVEVLSESRRPAGGPPGARPLRRRPRDLPAPALDALPAVVDFNDDGTFDPQEIARYQAVRRFYEFGDGGRLDVLLDRVVGRIGLQPEQILQVRPEMRAGKVELNRDAAEGNAALAARLEDRLGPEMFDRFRGLVVDAQVADITREVTEADREAARAAVWRQDTNEDGRLDAQELAALARKLSTHAGGFARIAPSGIDIREFSDRILAFDTDGDGAVAARELPERMMDFAREGDANGDGRLTLQEARTHFRRASFDRLRVSGIYVGGAFANVLAEEAHQLKQLDLPPEQAAETHRWIAAEEERQRQAATRVVLEQMARLKAISTGSPSRAPAAAEGTTSPVTGGE